VLDEPNAHLDAAGEAALLAALAELKALGVTVITVTHGATLMSALDKLARLNTGTLDLFGPSAAVLARVRLSAATQRVLAFPPGKASEALA
jgi:ATP-binding cassette subfamily C exporter for protease/lipase